MNKLILSLLLLAVVTLSLKAQDIPQSIEYYRIYEFLDELATDQVIELNTAVKPYSRKLIADKLVEASLLTDQLSKRQRDELAFFLNDFALERDRLPEGRVRLASNNKALAALWPPAFHYRDSVFRARITPILGMHLISNGNGTLDKRWFGAAFEGIVGNHFSFYGSLRDVSHGGADPLSKATYLNDQPGYEYSHEKDYSDMRAGIKYSNKYLSIGLMKDKVSWGDNLHGSNILSGRAPSFPMLYLQLKPASWFELNYFHGWLVSNVFDSTNYYVDNLGAKHLRMYNKFIAANLFTFTPIPRLKLSVGNSIVYAERNVIPAYFLPVAFYKSIDHTLNKGLGAENQNSQLFINISSRNIRHLHLFTSIFVDEMQFGRFLPDSPDRNPISWKLGGQLTNFPLQNLSVQAEFTRTNIINYKHAIPALSYASNSYNLGHYMGDNAQELFLALRYKPIRGLDIQASYVNALHGNDYEYIRHGFFNNTKASIIDIISNPSPGDVIWRNSTFGFKATYELFQNAYAIVQLDMSDIQTFDAESDVVFGENRMTAQEVMDKYTPPMLQGKNTTLTIGFSLGF